LQSEHDYGCSSAAGKLKPEIDGHRLRWMSVRSTIGAPTRSKRNLELTVHYLEIVSNDVDTLAALYQRVHGLSFGPPDADLGQARVATRADGTLVGIRKPLAAHEQSIMRTYLAVEDIHQAVKNAEDSGAAIAYPPTQQGRQGTFAIVIQGDVQHGLSERQF
jgi:predicted enzyme related to lactoylglutathione lyase